MRYARVCLGLVVLAAAALPAPAQTSMEGGARAAALGGAHTALPHDATGYANPASWATRGGPVLTLFATQGFGLEALRLASAHVVVPTRLGTISVGAQSFGFSDYRETEALGGYAHGFRVGTTRRFYAGVGLRYHRRTIAGYGSAGTLGLAFGGLVAVRPGLWAGFRAENLHVPKLNGQEALPRTLELGLAYAPTEHLLLVADVSKDVRFPVAVRAGLEARPVAAVALRMGGATAPARFTAGLGLVAGSLSADFAAERHETLGWSPAVAVGLAW